MRYFWNFVQAPQRSGPARQATGAAAVVAAGALAAAVAAGTDARAAHYRSLGRHGAWETVVVKLDGKQVTGAVTHPFSGCRAAVLIKGGEVALRLSGRWDLYPGDLVRMRVYIDGVLYRGRAVAINDQEFEVRLSKHFQTAIAGGDTAVIDIDRTRWMIDLYGLTASLKEAVAWKFPFLKEDQEEDD